MNMQLQLDIGTEAANQKQGLLVYHQTLVWRGVQAGNCMTCVQDSSQLTTPKRVERKFAYLAKHLCWQGEDWPGYKQHD